MPSTRQECVDGSYALPVGCLYREPTLQVRTKDVVMVGAVPMFEGFHRFKDLFLLMFPGLIVVHIVLLLLASLLLWATSRCTSKHLELDVTNGDSETPGHALGHAPGLEIKLDNQPKGCSGGDAQPANQMPHVGFFASGCFRCNRKQFRELEQCVREQRE